MKDKSRQSLQINSISPMYQLPTSSRVLLPPANEVWGKVICLQVSVCPQGGAWSGGAWSRGVPGPGGTWSWGSALWRPPGTATAAGGTHPTGMHSSHRCQIPFFVPGVECALLHLVIIGLFLFWLRLHTVSLFVPFGRHVAVFAQYTRV